MKSPTLFQLVMLVACAHGLVHVYEFALPSVEQQIADEFYAEDVAAGKALTGIISNSWRFAWGMGALLAGWLVDRCGGRLMLSIYLLGCSAMCALLYACSSSYSMFAVMLMMGGFASIYHPAGLALLSHHTTPENRPRALGLHGIIGSAGIGGAPLMAWIALHFGCTWRMFYLLLAVPGVVLSAYFIRTSAQDREQLAAAQPRPLIEGREDNANWASFFLLTFIAALQGLIYAAIMSFLPRFLNTPDDGSAIYSTLEYFGLIDTEGSVDGRFVASLVLLCGCLGQFLSGRLARPDILERQLAFVFLATVPFLLWMSIAEGTNRMIAAALFATIYFMHQPIYSSLIAKYSPPAQRSLCYGFGFAMAFGVGSFGASFGGFSSGSAVMYGVLTCIGIVASVLTIVLAALNRPPAS